MPQKSLRFRLVAYSLPFIALLIVFGTTELLLRQFWANGRYWHLERGIQGGIPIETNEQGFRGPVLGERRANELRILAIGDSTTFGMSEAYEDTWPAMLESLLVHELPDRHVVVANLAGIGRHPHLVATQLDRLIALDPDLIVYQLTLNDVVQRMDQLDQEKFQDVIRDASRWEQLRWRTTGLHFSLGRWRTFGLLQYLYRTAFPLSAESQVALGAYQFNSIGLGIEADNEAAWKDTEASLVQIATELKAQDIPLLVTVLPYQFQISDAPSDDPYGFNQLEQRIDPVNRLRLIAAENDFLLYDLKPAFSTASKTLQTDGNSGSSLFQPLDFVHPNAAGYRVVANAIQPIVLQLVVQPTSFVEQTFSVNQQLQLSDK